MDKNSDGLYVSCEEEHELRYLKDLILEEFPDFDKEAVDEALEQCCENVPAPHSRTDFWECLQSILGGEW